MRRISLLFILATCARAQSLCFIDRYQSTLSGAYASGGSSLSITSATGLPSGSSCFYYVIVKAEGSNTEEVFKVTSRSGTTLTVTGAQAGTSESNHSSGATVIASIMTGDAFLAAFPLLGTTTTSFSATPTFTLSTTHNKITLTGNVTSSTFSGGRDGFLYTFQICQDGTGGWTFVWPTSVKGGMTVGTTLSTCSTQAFVYDSGSSTYYAMTVGVINQ